MNFIVEPYDPVKEAIQLFAKFNAAPAAEREHSEEELIQLVVHKVKQHARIQS